MRFLSQYPGYGAQIRVQRQQGRGDGTVDVLVPGLYVKFQTTREGAFIYDNEQAEAMRHFKFHGNTQHEDQATPTDPINRISVLDTEEWARREGWSEEDKELVESRLLELSQTTPTEVLYVASTPITAPFPAWDRYDGDLIALGERLIEEEHDLDDVLYYEKTFGPNRPEMIEMLEAAIEARKAVEVQA